MVSGSVLMGALVVQCSASHFVITAYIPYPFGFLICACLSFIYTLLLLNVFLIGSGHMVVHLENKSQLGDKMAE